MVLPVPAVNVRSMRVEDTGVAETEPGGVGRALEAEVLPPVPELVVLVVVVELEFAALEYIPISVPDVNEYPPCSLG